MKRALDTSRVGNRVAAMVKMKHKVIQASCQWMVIVIIDRSSGSQTVRPEIARWKSRKILIHACCSEFKYIVWCEKLQTSIKNQSTQWIVIVSYNNMLKIVKFQIFS